jgi:hypothetical protein
MEITRLESETLEEHTQQKKEEDRKKEETESCGGLAGGCLLCDFCVSIKTSQQYFSGVLGY